MFVRVEYARLVRAALQRESIKPRPSEVVVSPEFETRLQDALGLVPGRQNVHAIRYTNLRLDHVLAVFARYQNAHPFQFILDGRVVSGRRTFLELSDNQPAERRAASV